MRRILLLLALVPLPANAADRTVSVSSFTRIRVDGPYVVEVRTGVGPAARASGDRSAIERVDLSQNGGTLVVRAGSGGWGERPSGRPSRPVTITLGTPRLVGVAIGANSEVRVGAMKGPRIDLTVTGAGKLSVDRAEADQLVATVVGPGALDLAGKATSARVMVNGEGAITAPDFAAGDLTARVEGPGAVTVGARFTANVTTTGLGKVTVLGAPKCEIRAPAGGPVTCGSASPAATRGGD
jgi:hypothetical protein